MTANNGAYVIIWEVVLCLTKEQSKPTTPVPVPMNDLTKDTKEIPEPFVNADVPDNQLSDEVSSSTLDKLPGKVEVVWGEETVALVPQVSVKP